MANLEVIINFCKKYSQEKFFSPANQLVYYPWSHEQIEKLNRGYKIREFMPGFIGFGSDGGNELLSIDEKTDEIYSIPFVIMERKEAIKIAEDIDQFITYKQ